MKQLLAIILAALFFTTIVGVATATTTSELIVSIKSVKQIIEVEDKVKIDLSLNTQETISAIQGRVRLPNYVDIDTISTEGSLITSWTIYPSSAEIDLFGGSPTIEVSFAGAIPGGFTGEGKLFSIIGTVKKPGNEIINIDGIKVLLNDGLGTEAETIVKPQKLQVRAGAVYKERMKKELKKNNDAYTKEQNNVKEEKVLTKEFNKPTTRCEFIVMNGNKAKWQEKKSWGQYKNRKISSNFTDLGNFRWCIPFADYAFDNNIMKGKGKIFGASNPINRYEVAATVSNQIANKFEMENIKDANSNLTDNKQIPEWARASVVYLRNRGIFTGSANPNGTYTFRGGDYITKINAAIVLSRGFNYKGR